MCETIVVTGDLIPDPEEPILDGWVTSISALNQPERSKREDGLIERDVFSLICNGCNNEVLYLHTADRKSVNCRCGTLNSRETD